MIEQTEAVRELAVEQASLTITEIFLSLQGEARSVGLPTVFVRLTGCPLRCQYCDSAYAFYGGERLSFAAIMERVRNFAVARVCVTGGEPLMQKPVRAFMQLLCDEGFEVSLETSGALPIHDIDTRVSRVMDLKTPGSGELHRNRMDNLALLSKHDQLKFVLCDRADYEWARALLREQTLDQRTEVLFSPSYGQLAPQDLAAWILQDRLPVRFQWQLHKQLWGDVPGR